MKKKVLIVLLIIAIVTSIVVVYRRRKNKISDNSSNNSNGNGSGSNTTTSKWQADNFPLKKYCSGQRVKNLQNFYNWAVDQVWKQYPSKKSQYPKLTVDGKWGDKTDAAFKGMTGGADGVITLEEYNVLISSWNEARNGKSTSSTYPADYTSNPNSYYNNHLGFGII